MAFCTNCGANMDPNATSAAPAQAAPPAQTYPPAAQTYTPQPAKASGGGGAMKVVLIVVGVFVLIGCVSLAGLIFAVHRVKNKLRNGVHITQNGDNSVVDTPFGRASTSTGDARAVARQIGVELYPGATAGESSTSQFGKMSSSTIKLTTTDSVAQVAKFYQSRYPHAMVSQENADKFTLVGTDKDGTLTVTAESTGDGTRIEIAKVGGLKINVSNQ
jgi:hypothetical protein